MLNFGIDTICSGYFSKGTLYYFVESDGPIAVEADQHWLKIYEISQYSSTIWSFRVEYNDWESGSAGQTRSGNITITNTKTGQQKGVSAIQKYTNSIIAANGLDAVDYLVTATDTETPMTSIINGINVSGATMTISGLSDATITALDTDAYGNNICAVMAILPEGEGTGLSWYKVMGTSNDGQSIWQWFSIYRTARLGLPVWKDTFCELISKNAYADYEIHNDKNNEIIYKGRAYRLPSEATVKIKVNEIVQNYLRSNINFSILDEWQNTGSDFNFTIYANGSPIQSYFTWLDFSYEKPLLSVTPVSFPITGELDRRQTFVCSWLQTANTDIACRIDGNGGEILWDDEAVSGGNAGLYTFVSSGISEMPGSNEIGVYAIEHSIHINELITYKFINACNKYNLIYLNKYGGWDTLLMKGTDTMTDTWTNYQIDRAFDNTTRQFEREHYLKGIDKKIKMNTGWLTEEQSLRMDNLLESNRIYLENLEDGTIIPVIITDTSFDYKTTANQGKKAINYTINVQYSQQRRRR